MHSCVSVIHIQLNKEIEELDNDNDDFDSNDEYDDEMYDWGEEKGDFTKRYNAHTFQVSFIVDIKNDSLSLSKLF